MLDSDQSDQSDQSDRTEAAAGETPGSPPDASPGAALPVVTRRTRKAPAKKAVAAAPEAPIDAVADPVAEAAPAKKAAARKAPAKKAAAKRTTARTTEAAAGPGVVEASEAPAPDEAAAPAKKTTARKAAAKAPAKKAASRRSTAKKAAPAPEQPDEAPEAPPADETSGHAVLFQAPVATTTRRTRRRTEPDADEPSVAEATPDVSPDVTAEDESDEAAAEAPARGAGRKQAGKKASGTTSASKKSGARKAAGQAPDQAPDEADEEAGDEADQPVPAQTDDGDESRDSSTQDDEAGDGEGGQARRRRRRGGRRRRKSSDDNADGSDESGSADASEASSDEADGVAAPDDESGPDDSAEGNGEGTSRRRRRRRRSGDDGGADDADPNTVTRVRKSRTAEDQITAVAGSTRLEAKKQRRREGREAGRRRAPIVSEAEFLARRESVERVMVIRQRKDLIQIGVLEDKVLVEHYVARESQTSLIGNVYLGRVQNVLPSMEAAFIDIGKGRNAVLYAGEVNWSSLGHKEGQPRKIESVLSSGQMILVQVTKDPIGHKGARLTSQISLAGRFLVYVPDGTTSGISRKLPDTERNRLKTLLKEIVPDTAGVIVRTAAEGASEEELTRDVERLRSRWEDIEKKSTNKGSGPQLLYGEPDLTLKVVRDLFTEDFAKLVIEGDDAWDTVHAYVESVAPDLAERVEKFERGTTGGDIFATFRVDEQIQKGLDRKVWLPSGGSLIIDRTEAMTVVDVNTGKFTGSGGNLEETVTKNNLEAAEEIVRQLRLRDIGGIIVVDFIDMVLESNRDLVVRRLVECLGRDRTRHQVAEVTSLGLVQMTRKRIGTGLVEAFSENCEHCQGRGVVIKDQPVDPHAKSEEGDGRRTSSRRRGRRGASDDAFGSDKPAEQSSAPSPKVIAAMARHEKSAEQSDETPADTVETPAEASVEPQVEEAPTEASVETPAETPAEASVEPAVEEAPAETEKPRVVTRTRRRAASRPAGPPALPQTVATSAAAGRLPSSGLVEPGTVAVEPGVGTLTVEEPAAEAPTVEHVPIKKKGSRKR